MNRWLVILIVVGILLSGCTRDTTADTSAASAVASPTPTQATTVPSVTTTVLTEDTAAPQDEAQSESVGDVDLLTFANGALFASETGLAGDGSVAALSMIDGNMEMRAFPEVDGSVVEFVFELPAETIFGSFAVPEATDGSGALPTFDEIEIAGSSLGPDSGFEDLASGTLRDPVEGMTSLDPVARPAVRWIRVTLSPPEAGTSPGFTELIGYGTQEEVPLNEGFAGAWELRPAGAQGGRAVLMWLAQDGTSLSGCIGQITFAGTVNGSIARATGLNPADGTRRAYIFIADGRGGLQGVVSETGGPFGARVGVAADISRPAPCAEQLPEPAACGSTVYVNFSVDSAEVRPESKPVLVDLFARLQGESPTALTIEGHTSTEGTDAYNQDLSERRAQAVVDELVKRGLEPGTLVAVGKGETEPIIFPELDEAARSINRRVEIRCE